MSKDEALKMAGYDLDGVIADVEKFDGFDNVCLETIKRVRNVIAEALEQPAQEPYCWCFLDMLVSKEEAKSYEQDEDFKGAKAFPLYTHPYQWQGLTDDEIQNITWKIWGADALEPELDYARAIEAKLKEINK